MENTFDIVKNIASKLIGLELEPVSPMSDEETKKWIKEHTKEYVEPDYYKGKRPYTLKPEEREIVKRFLKTDDIGLDELTININDDGKILARTPDYTWYSLYGREWLIDLENESHELVCMN